MLSRVNCFHEMKEKMFTLLMQTTFNTLVVTDSLKSTEFAEDPALSWTEY